MGFPLNSGIIDIIINQGVLVNEYGKFIYTDNGAILVDGHEIKGEVIINGRRNSPEIKRLEFRNCKFHDGLKITGHSYIASYKFDNVIFFGHVEIEALNRRIEFLNGCKFHHNVEIDTNGAVSLTITDAAFDETLTLRQQFNEVVLKNININLVPNNDGRVALRLLAARINYLKASSIRFDKVDLTEKTFLIHEAFFDDLKSGNLNINHITIGLYLQLKSSNLGRLYIDNLETTHRHLRITDGTTITQVDFPMHQFDRMDIYKASFGEIGFWGTNNKDGIVNIENITFNSLTFRSVVNLGSLTLRGIEAQNGWSLKLKSSDFGKASFISCKFEKSLFEFDNCKVTEVFLSETDFPKEVYKDEKESPTQAQLAFGQLQTAFQKQGDSVRALEYHSREIAAHYRSVNLFSKDLFVKFNLFLNLISNNFGRWWWLGIIFTVGIGFIFFMALIWSTTLFSRFWNDVHLVPFIKFMSPIRSFDLEVLFQDNSGKTTLHLTNWSYFWDILGRIFITYGYYQTVQAFRKFGKT